MTRTLFGPSITFRWLASKAAIIVLAIYMLALNGSSAQHVSSREAKRDAEIAGVKFAVPKDFKLESVDASVAFLRHETSEPKTIHAHVRDIARKIAKKMRQNPNPISLTALNHGRSL